MRVAIRLMYTTPANALPPSNPIRLPPDQAYPRRVEMKIAPSFTGAVASPHAKAGGNRKRAVLRKRLTKKESLIRISLIVATT